MDYNIYIHSQGGGQSNPTLPWKPTDTNPTQPWKPDTDEPDLETPNELAEGGFKAMTKGTKAGVIIGAAVVVAATAMKVYNTSLTFYEPATGDYTHTYEMSNLKNALSWVMNAPGKLLDFHRNMQSEKLANQRRTENMRLTGNSVINGDYSL